MKYRRFTALARGVLLLGLVAGAAAGTARADDGDPIGDVERGRILYLQYSCYACHGYTGETGSGTRLNPPRLDQPGFIAYLRTPSGAVVAGGPAGRMPAYAGDTVTDQKLADIHAWLRSLPSSSPPLEDITLLAR